MNKSYLRLILISMLSLFFATSCFDTNKGPVAISFNDLRVNGSTAETTTSLTLTLSKVVESLTPGNITLNAGTTGCTKGALTSTDDGMYELVLAGVTAAGRVTVTLTKEGYEFTPASLEVEVYKGQNTIYAAGTMDDKATLWTNGTPQTLFAGNGYTDSHANSVSVSGTDVYVAGVATNAAGRDAAILWKNGQMQSVLSDGVTDAKAISVFASGVDVYVAGYVQNVAGKHVATLWKNGQTLPPLSSGTTDSEATSVFATTGGEVYIAGSIQNAVGTDIATLWKVNGQTTSLSDGATDAEANCVVVAAGGEIYVAGSVIGAANNSVATLWRSNDVSKSLSDGVTDAEANSIFINGTDVYVAGATDRPVATIWKNSDPVQILGDGSAKSIFVCNGTIYAGGYVTNAADKDVATVWTNGLPQTLSTTDSEVRSIYVIQK